MGGGGLEYLGEGGWSTWERGIGVPERGVGVPGRGGEEYLGEGLGTWEMGWSIWERVGVPGRGGLEYLGEGGWSTSPFHTMTSHSS